MTSCKPPPTCIDASPIPDANDSRMSAIPYEANLTPMGARPRPRTSSINEHAARHATLCGSAKGCHDLLPALIIGKDEIEQVHMVLGAIDVGHERVDGGVIVGQERDAVARQGRKVT